MLKARKMSSCLHMPKKEAASLHHKAKSYVKKIPCAKHATCATSNAFIIAWTNQPAGHQETPFPTHNLLRSARLLSCKCLQVAAPWERPFEARFIKNMELVVLARLQWQVTAITAVSFLDRLLYGAAGCASLLKDDGLLHRMRHRAGLLVTKALPGETGWPFCGPTIYCNQAV